MTHTPPLRSLLLCLSSAALALCCTKEEYTARFGVQPTYQLHAGQSTETPATEDGWLVAQVSYLSPCANGGSKFEVDHLNKEGMDVFIARRDAPSCEQQLPEAQLWTGRVVVACQQSQQSCKGKTSRASWPSRQMASTNSGSCGNGPALWRSPQCRSQWWRRSSKRR